MNTSYICGWQEGKVGKGQQEHSNGRMVAIFLPQSAMSLNIKDPETHELAAALAKATGESMTRAVTLAIQERLERIRKQRRASASELLAIGARCAESLTARPADHGGLLYDELGLPK